MADFERALSEVKPAFGAVTETLEAYRRYGMIRSGPRMQQLMATCKTLVSRVSHEGPVQGVGSPSHHESPLWAVAAGHFLFRNCKMNSLSGSRVCR